MAVPLKKMVRAAPPQFDLRRLPAMAWGALLGGLKSLVRVGTIAFIVVAPWFGLHPFCQSARRGQARTGPLRRDRFV